MPINWHYLSPQGDISVGLGHAKEEGVSERQQDLVMVRDVFMPLDRSSIRRLAVGEVASRGTVPAKHQL